MSEQVETLIESLPWRIKGDYRLQIRKYYDGSAKYQVAYFDLDGYLHKDIFSHSLSLALKAMADYIKHRPELLV